MSAATLPAPGPARALELPALGPARRLKLPPWAERTLPNGLTVIAVRRPAVPLVELRLRMPFARAPLARSLTLAQALFSGTSGRSAMDIAADLQTVGGGLGSDTDPDWLSVSGNCLASGLPTVLDILAEILSDATYPADEVAAERERLADHIEVALSQPSHLARVALLRRRYGSHPYAEQTPGVDQVRAVGAGHLRKLHADRVAPAGAILTVVGDVRPEKALDQVEAALGGWVNEASVRSTPGVPAVAPQPLLLVDRPGAVQSSMRLALPAVGRSHPDYPALQLANLVFGGYFSSRWVENIREDKGYTYGPNSYIEHNAAGSTLVVAAEVATDVTAPALLETFYELGRLSAVPPAGAELEQARQYALGSLRIGIATQAGLASLVSAYASFGLRLPDLAGYAEAVAAVTPDQVAEAAARYLSPLRALPVLLGDAAAVAGPLAALVPVERDQP
ncbi:pitrilysin family protein [Pilimelia columellifera]|uniref:Pitrilysin family protein n=1 Tax=Pilimelia columellifera subsp. columellifera TaxID=706583 RepID=A0ABP6ADT4_9ACTN